MSSLINPHLESTTYAGSFAGGSPFRILGETEGRVLQRIRISRIAASIDAIEFWLTGDSTPRVYGTVRSENSSFEFSEGERITRLRFRSSTFGIGQTQWNHVARVWFSTSRGRTFEYGSTREPTGQWFEANVGSGVCVGVAGNVMLNSLNMLGFVFLRSIQRVGFSSVEYPTFSTSITTTSILEQLPDTLKSNDDEEPLQVVLAGSRQFKTTSTWRAPSPAVGLLSHLTGNNILVDVSTLGINTPTVVPTGPAGASTTFRWQTVRTFPSPNGIQGSIANLTVSTDEYSVWCHISDTVAPAQSLPKHAAWVGEGRITALPCSANIQVITSGGNNLPFATFSFPVRLLYDGGAHSNVQIL